MAVPENLRQVAERIRESGDPHVETVRTLLSWFGQQRRGRWVVTTIRSALRELGLRTNPDFETAYIDGALIFRLEEEADEAQQPEEAGEAAVAQETSDPVARIRQLPAANRPPVTVTRDSRVSEAVTLMLMNDFSQLPVMPNERTIHGLVSWRTIGRARAGNHPCNYVRECMEPAVEVRDDAPLLEAIAVIAEQEVVLVRGSDRRITGLVTTSDLSLQFHELAEPFLLLSEIENHIRRLIEGKFSVDELTAARHPADEDRIVEGVADLTFGEYARLLESRENWEKLNLDLDRARFVQQIQRVREVRNDVMHFSPDGVSPDDLELLRDTVRFMQQIQPPGR